MYFPKKKFLSACLMSMMAFAVSVLPAYAEETAAVQTSESAAKDPDIYIFSSPQYGYTMLCPHRPVGVIPASMLYEDKKGDVVVFENDGYTLRHAWVILVDSFNTKDVPDFNKITEQEASDYLQKLMRSSAYEGISLVNLSENNKGVFGISAKEVEIDTNGDGVFDVTAKADTQEAVVFFRTEKGRCFTAHLIDNPELRTDSISAFQFGISSLQEMDSKAVQK